MKSFVLLQLLALTLTNCGGESKLSSSPDSVQSQVSPMMTMALDTAADLPVCDNLHENQLVYIMESRQFQTCKKGSWTAISIQGTDGKDGQAGKDGQVGKDGADGLRISKIWEYTDSVYSVDDYLSEGGFALIGDIRIIEFSDGSYQVNVNGQTLLSETSGDVSINDFNHNFFLPKGTKTESMKLTSYANTVMYYKLNVTATGPELDIALDTDNNISNNVATTYIPAKSWPN